MVSDMISVWPLDGDRLLLSDINSLRQESHVKSWVLSFLTILGGGKQCDGLPMIHAFLS